MSAVTTSVHGPAGDCPPDKMDWHEKSRLRAAAYQAKQRYPGAVGELLSREILAAEEFGYRLGGQAVVRAVVDQIMKPSTA